MDYWRLDESEGEKDDMTWNKLLMMKARRR